LTENAKATNPKRIAGIRNAPGRVIATLFTLNNLKHIKNRNKKRVVSLKDLQHPISAQSIPGETACWFGCIL
jgi:hypothetical protein